MRLSELFDGIRIIKTNVRDEKNIDIGYITSDSRKARKNSAFVCLKGQKYDGHIWIDTALENGAELIVCQEEPRNDVPFVLVEDTRPVLPMMLSNFYSHPEKSFENVIGITGTNGKTSTSFMLKKIFEANGKKTVLLGTTKYLIGDREFKTHENDVFLTTPDPELLYEILACARDENCRVLIMEVSSHSLYFKKVRGIPFTYGIFTNLTQDHLDFHKTMDAYLEAKKLLFYSCKKGVFNADDPNFSRISGNVPCGISTYGAENQSAAYRADNADYSSPLGVSYDLVANGKTYPVKVPVPGKFTVYNSLAALSTAIDAGLDPEKCIKAISEMDGVKGRVERIETNTPYSVFIDFAHTPDALSNVICTLRQFTENRLITLFGCGGDRDKTKRPIMARIALELSDMVIITSDNSRTEEKEDIIRDILEGTKGSSVPFVAITERTEAIKYALDHAEKGDIILLAGKGHEEYEIDKTGKHPYSERKIVLGYLGEKK